MKQYRLLKNYETPTSTIRKGVVKTEEDWINIFPLLDKGDCSIKTDWFELVEEEKGIEFHSVVSVDCNKNGCTALIILSDLGRPIQKHISVNEITDILIQKVLAEKGVPNEDLHNIESILEENQRLKEWVEKEILSKDKWKRNYFALNNRFHEMLDKQTKDKQWSDADMIEFGFDIAHTKLIAGSMYELNSDVAKRLDQFQKSKQK